MRLWIENSHYFKNSGHITVTTCTKWFVLYLSSCLRLVEEALASERARRHKSQRLCGSRHPSFGGTFVVKNQKSISGGNRVYHRRLAGVCVCGVGGVVVVVCGCVWVGVWLQYILYKAIFTLKYFQNILK